MKKDYIVTFLTEFFVLASGILVYKLAAVWLGKVGFSEYALSRRTLSLIQPALLMGLSIGIPRYIAYSSANTNSKKSDGYFISGISILAIVVLISTLILSLFKNGFAFLMFGSSHYFYLVRPINLMIAGSIIHAACYSYYRGRLLMVRANVLQLINLGFVPLLAFALGKTPKLVLGITGVGWLVVSFFFLVLIMKSLDWKNMSIVSQSKELITYGLQRVPGDFGMAALFALPATFTAHAAGVKTAGYVAFGTSLLSMAGSVFAPVGLVLLPKASQIIASKDLKLLKHYVSKLLKITFLLTALGVIIFELFAGQIISLYLGKSFSDIVLITRIIMIAALAYTVFVSLRSIIDAYYVKAMNTINILLSLLLFLALSGIAVLVLKGYIYLIASLVIALFLLGSLTLLETSKILKREDHVG